MKKPSKILMLGILLLVTIVLMVSGVAWGQDRSAPANAPAPHAPSEFTNFVYAPLMLNRFVTLSRPNIFGVQMPGNTGPSNPYYEHMIETGSSWIRVPISWYIIQPNEGDPYNWNSVDTFTQAAQHRYGGLKFILSVGGNPAWASPWKNGPIDPENISDYVAFLAAAVERYDGDGYLDAPGTPRVDYWEIYNEPDSGWTDYRKSWGHYGDKYAALLQAVYPAIKAANPQAQVVMGGLAYDWFEDQGGPMVREFLDDVLAHGGGNYFDIMNYHVYPPFWYNWTSPQSPGLYEKAVFIKNKLASYGYPNKPTIITEAGFHSNEDAPTPGDPESQARYVVELFTQSMAVGVETMVWFQLHDPTDGWLYMNGLVTGYFPPDPPDPATLPSKKYSYIAFQTAVREIGSAEFHRILSDAETGSSSMEAYELRDTIHQRTVYVAWMDPIDTTLVRQLRVPAETAVVKTLYGATTTVYDIQDGANDGRVTVNVSGQPIYIEVGW